MVNEDRKPEGSCICKRIKAEDQVKGRKNANERFPRGWRRKRMSASKLEIACFRGGYRWELVARGRKKSSRKR